MRVLVTGSQGFIGRHIARVLRDLGHEVLGVDCQRPETASSWEYTTDYSEFIALVAHGDFDAVVHQAAITDTTVESSVELTRVNSSDVKKLAVACAASGTRLVHASSCSVYGRLSDTKAIVDVGDELNSRRCSGPLNPYAESKLAADISLSGIVGLNFVAFRYTNVFGPGEAAKGAMSSIVSQLLRKAVAGQPLTLFNDTLSASRDYVPVHRVTDLVALALGERADVRGVFNLGSGHSVPFYEVLHWICALDVESSHTLTLCPNPYKDRYQYVTRVEQARTDRRFGGYPPSLSRHDVRCAIEALHKHYVSTQNERF